MNIYTKNNETLNRKSCIIADNTTDGHIELIQTKELNNRYPIDILFGDIGIYKIKVKTNKNINHILNDKDINVLNYEYNIIQDLDKNIIELEYDNNISGTHIYGFTIGVSDTEKSINFYKNLNFKKIRTEISENGFKDTKFYNGGERNMIRTILKNNNTIIELIQVKEDNVKNIFENRYWGDIGYVHIGFQYEDEYFNNNNLVKTVDSGKDFHMGNLKLLFCYTEDPDKILVEFTRIYYYKLLFFNINVKKYKSIILNILKIKSLFNI